MAFVIPTIYTAIDRMSATQQKIAAGNQLIGTSATIAAARMERSLNAISEKSMMVGRSALGLGIALTLPLGLAAASAMKFEKEMGNVATLVDTSKESIANMGDEVLAISKKVPVAISDLTESLYQIRSEGFGGAYAMDILGESAKLSVAGLSSATEATKSMASAIRVFGKDGLSTQQIADLFFKTVAVGRTKMDAINESFGSTAPIVREAGVSLQEFLAATAAMTNAGNTASESMVALRGATIALIKPSGEMERVLHAAGVRTGQELIQKFGGLIPAMKAVGDIAKKTGINVNDAFGRVQGLTAYTLLTGSLSEQFNLDMARMSNGVIELKDAFAKQAGTTAAQWAQLKNNVQILGIRIGTLLLPAVISLSNAFLAIIQPIANFAKNHKTLSGIIFKSLFYIGALSLSISALSFVFGGITKATWLWRGGLYALNFILGFSGVLTGKLTQAMYANIGMMKGAELATMGWRGAMVSLLTTTNLVLGGLIAIYMYRNKIQNWANDTSLGRGYNNMIGDKDAVRESLQRMYIEDPVKAKKFIEDNPKYNTPDIQGDFNKIDSGNDLGNSNDEIIMEKNIKNINHHFTIDLKQNGQTVKQISSKDLMPTVTSTSNYGE